MWIAPKIVCVCCILVIGETIFNPLTAKNEISLPENMTFLWTWILRWLPRSAATHASLCNTLSSNKLSKTVKILAVKGLSFVSCEQCIIE